jgi:predicted deacylase
MSAMQGITGTLQTGTWDVLELPDRTVVRLAYAVVRGIDQGPKLVLTAAVHGWEIVGTEVIRRLLQEKIDPKNLKGTVVAFPVANPLAFHVRAWITPQDHADVSSSLPGDPAGTQSQRVAHKLWEAIHNSDCYMDLHCMEGPSVPFTILRGPENDPVVDRSLKIANAFGVPITRASPETLKHRPNAATDAAISHGIPSIIPEFPFPSIFMEDSVVEVGVRGVLNVMKFLGMIPGNLEEQKHRIKERGPFYTQSIKASHGGILHITCELGSWIKKGEKLAKILDVFGNETEAILAPKDGYIISFPLNVNQIVGTGDPVAVVAYPPNA